jgi:hypothetical protein
MATKKTPVVKEQGFKKFYIASDWDISSTFDDTFDDFVNLSGTTVEEATKTFLDCQDSMPKYVYVVTEQLKAVTTYK